MAGARDFLNRFRPAGTPGPAARAGVPADRSADAAAELGPVLDQLAGVEAECAGLLAAGRLDAEAIRQRAAEQAAGFLASARANAPAERAAAAASARSAADAESARILQEAARQAAELRERSGHRLPGHLEQVVGLVRSVGLGEREHAGGQAAPAGGRR